MSDFTCEKACSRPMHALQQLLFILMGWSTSAKRYIVAAMDWLLILICQLLIHGLLQDSPGSMSWLVLGFPTLTVACLHGFRLYHAVFRYIGLSDYLRICAATSIAALAALLLDQLMSSRPEPLAHHVLSLVLATYVVSLPRLLYRFLFKLSCRGSLKGRGIFVYGAGSGGAQLASSLRFSNDYVITAFVDDKPATHFKRLRGIPIYPPDSLPELKRKLDVDTVVLAMPSIDAPLRNEIVERLMNLGFKVKTMPSLHDLIGQRAQARDLREIQIEELLSRPPVPPDPARIRACVQGKSVMVTGAGGSIGSELCRQAIAYGAKRLVLFEISEFALYSIHRELSAIKDISTEIVPILGSVCDLERLQMAMTNFQVQVVYHAAAYKHVPLVEANPLEGIRNNVLGTLYTAKTAQEAGVELFVLISTDKAVRPTNIMGASKRLAELVLQAMAQEQSLVRFTMVRFGNVLGSSGSVVPLFKSQIAAGGPVTVTHPEITRYFMTIPEAVGLVMLAGAMCEGGEVFVLDMGKPVKIVDLAYKMIRLSGFTARDQATPDGDIEIHFSGLRPGEKLYEELLIGGGDTPTAHPMIFMAKEGCLPMEQVLRVVEELHAILRAYDLHALRELLRRIVEGYTPHGAICCPVWTQGQAELPATLPPRG